MHAGLIKSSVHIEPSVVDTISVGSSPVVVKQPLKSDSPITGIGNDIHNSLGDAVTHLRGCASRANLMILDVPGDGNCLILYQLKANGACASSTSISKLRLITAAYLEGHSDFYSHFLGESILSSNPMNADTEAPDDDDAQVSLIPDPHERSQARWLKYINRIRHGAWGDNLCIAALANVSVNVYTATQTGCTVNPITPIEGNSLFDINIGLVLQWHFVGLDKMIFQLPVMPCDLPQSELQTLIKTRESDSVYQTPKDPTCCDSDSVKGSRCCDSDSVKGSTCCDSDTSGRDHQSSDDIEIDEDTFKKGDQYSSQITGGPSASMMSVEDPEAFAEIVCIAPGEGQKPLYIFTDEHLESMSNPDKFPYGRGCF